MILRGIITILLLGCLLNGVYGLNITDCGTDDSVKIYEITVSLCENVDLCPLIRGNTTILTITFGVDSPVETLIAQVRGTINDGKMFLPFPYKNRQACAEERGLDCPLNPGQNYTYTAPIEIKSLFPKINSTVKWQLKDEDKVIICILIPSVILDP